MTTDELVARVKDAGSLAIRADTTSQKILDEANSEYSSRLIPIFRKMRGGFFRDSTDVAIVANQVSYDIPERAIESGIESIKYLDADGNELYALNEVSTPKIGQLTPRYQLVSDTTATVPVAFYFTQGKINLTPVVTSSTGSLRIYYSRRPGKLVLDAVVASQHTAVGTILSNNDFDMTFNANHNGWPASQKLDIMSAKSPFVLLAKDLQADTAVAGTATVTLLGTTVDLRTIGMVPGDYVTLAKQSYIPEIPQEWHELLLDLTLAKMFNKVGQRQSEESMRASASEKLALLVASTSPRGTATRKRVFPSW